MNRWVGLFFCLCAVNVYAQESTLKIDGWILQANTDLKTVDQALAKFSEQGKDYNSCDVNRLQMQRESIVEFLDISKQLRTLENNFFQLKESLQSHLSNLDSLSLSATGKAVTIAQLKEIVATYNSRIQSCKSERECDLLEKQITNPDLNEFSINGKDIRLDLLKLDNAAIKVRLVRDGRQFKVEVEMNVSWSEDAKGFFLVSVTNQQQGRFFLTARGIGYRFDLLNPNELSEATRDNFWKAIVNATPTMKELPIAPAQREPYIWARYDYKNECKSEKIFTDGSNLDLYVPLSQYVVSVEAYTKKIAESDEQSIYYYAAVYRHHKQIEIYSPSVYNQYDRLWRWASMDSDIPELCILLGFKKSNRIRTPITSIEALRWTVRDQYFHKHALKIARSEYSPTSTFNTQTKKIKYDLVHISKEGHATPISKDQPGHPILKMECSL